ncbi:RNA 2',3'-cyclic phosphodiesterase [Actinacidiphila acidipaludis]|uniref:RNA 2',3'-cyclic phosphodiesterase n=1 Tax=Actinacidiphila acidipaludis TaxID=2873382 RepID=A0ABS7QIF7_9ACTN|nr:RNA 2',3'-cyclic phosphodiesterase [Streptomyces acidipaludis]MBY8882469.1 RNA 2',3'-cyclic phosphodiesterase [Streptomyces acidipaludis]
MRLFAALVPPPAAAGELAAALGPVRRLPGAEALRWTAPEGWHFTLAFLAEVPDEVRPELDERLARAAYRHGPYELRLVGGGRFGDRTLWMGAEGDLRGLSHLADSVRAGARRAGAPPAEEHGFRAHLTLARTPRGHSTRLLPFAEALAGFQGTPWTADELRLVASVLPRSGVPGEQPRYEVVGRYPLGGAHRTSRGEGDGSGTGTGNPGDGAPGAAG